MPIHLCMPIHLAASPLPTAAVAWLSCGLALEATRLTGAGGSQLIEAGGSLPEEDDNGVDNFVLSSVAHKVDGVAPLVVDPLG